jgi:predicted ATPase/class 3 adenylate cyclase
MPTLPTGTVTFLFTDIEGSTAHWEQHDASMRAALARHDALLRDAIERHGGAVFKTWGDAFCAAFATAPDALAAALVAQRALPAPLRVRMAIHTGAAEQRDGDYYGQPLNRVARLLAAGHGGQILVSAAAAELVRDALPDGVTLLDLGDHRLKDLAGPEHIAQVVAPALPAEFPPLRTIDLHPHNLPVQRTPLVGRVQEIAEVVALLRRRDIGVLTLTGPGGAGKTRLALQAGADLLDDFADGVFFVSLAPITQPELAAPAIAQALAVREAEGRSVVESLTTYLRDKTLLLVLDNFEQILGAAPLVAELLAACPRLKALVTSRAALHIRGEQELPVPPLPLPPLGVGSWMLGDGERDSRARQELIANTHHPIPFTQYAAVELFIQRARAVQPEFTVTNANAPAVAEICTRLDGLPLAIELAAARIKLLPPRTMLVRLDQRLKLLTGGARDLPVRQQTLRDAIAWSYDLLTADEQALFCRLAVFVGGCRLEAAEAVCSADGDLGVDVLDGIASLLDKSLLRQAEEPEGEPRYTMLETVREFALEQLVARGEAGVARQRHALWFLDLAEAAASQVRGPSQVAWLNRVEGDYDNLRAAFTWFMEADDSEPAMRLAGSLWWYWIVRGGFAEGRDWLERTLGSGRGSVSARATALISLGYLLSTQAEHAESVSRLEEAVALQRSAGDLRGTITALNWLGNILARSTEFDRAETIHTEVLHLRREIGDRYSVASSQGNLGLIAVLRGDWPAAQSLFEEILPVVRDHGDVWGLALTLHSLSIVALNQGDLHGATRYATEAIPYWRALNDSNTGGLLMVFAALAQKSGQADRAVRLFGAAEAMFEQRGDLFLAGAMVRSRLYGPRDAEELHTLLDEEAFAAAWASGRALTTDEAIALALERPAEAEGPIH